MRQSSGSIASALVVLAVLLLSVPPAGAGPKEALVQGTTQSGGDTSSVAIFVGKLGETVTQVPLTQPSAKGQTWRCRFLPTWGFGDSGVPAGSDGSVTPVKGGAYHLVCIDPAGNEVFRSDLRVYDPGNPAAMLGPTTTVAPRLDEALAQIRAGRPDLRAAPPIDRRQLVGVRTWFWLPGWEALTADATPPGTPDYTATVHGRPTHLTIDPGDGSPAFTCGPDTPAWHEGLQHTPCGHTYHRSSTDRPGGTFTITYSVTWGATGPGLQLADQPLGPITSQGTFPLTVRDAQAVIR